MDAEPVILRGHTVAWACGKCGYIHGTGERAMVAIHGTEHDKRQAVSCCTCNTCGAEIDGISRVWCDACIAKQHADSEAERPEREAKIARERAVYDAALAKSLDPLAAKMLKQRMSDISEDCYCAGWMGGLEFSLWEMVEGGSRSYGMGEVPEADVQELKALSERAGGWWYWDKPELNELFISTAEWLPKYAAHKR